MQSPTIGLTIMNLLALCITLLAAAAVDDMKVELNQETKAKAFDLVWERMDRHYSYFALKHNVDWAKLRDQYRPRALAAMDESAFVQVLKEMLAHLKDIHVWIQTPKGIVPTFANPWKRNFNERIVFRGLEKPERIGTFAFVGKTKDGGFGYFMLLNQPQANENNVAQAIAAIDRLADAAGFVVDLRSASGGNELLARKIAQRFCGADVVYAGAKVRKGTPDHNDFGSVQRRVLPAGAMPFTKPIICLIGTKCVSSGEGFAKMMKALPHCTMVGEPTRGASGNPKPIALPGMKSSVWHSTWVDMMPDGSTFEGKGLAPDVPVDLPYTAYANDDPTFRKAIEILRDKTAK